MGSLGLCPRGAPAASPRPGLACRATLGEWVGRAEKSLHKPTLFKKTDLPGQDPLIFPVQGPFALISSIKQTSSSSSSSGVEGRKGWWEGPEWFTLTLLRESGICFPAYWGQSWECENQRRVPFGPPTVVPGGLVSKSGAGGLECYFTSGWGLSSFLTLHAGASRRRLGPRAFPGAQRGRSRMVPSLGQAGTASALRGTQRNAP